MKSLVSSWSLLLLVVFGVKCFPFPPDFRTRYDGHRLIHVSPSSDHHVRSLQRLESDGIDFWKHPFINRTVTFRVPPEHYTSVKDTLTGIRLPFKVALHDIQKLLDQEHNDRHATDGRKTVSSEVVENFSRHSDINKWLLKLNSLYPKITSIIDIGETFEGRTQRVIKIGSPGVHKLALWIDGGMHAREWITVTTVNYIIDRLLKDYGRDAATTRLLDTYDVYLLPIANPDGYEYTFTDRLWRKTRRDNGLNTCRGADPNRNFGVGLDSSGFRNNPCSNTYPGPRPFSEKCAQNIAKFLTDHNDSIVLYLSLHAHAQFWLTPWAHTTSEPDDNEEMLRVANIGKKALELTNGRTYTVGAPAKLLYKAFGVSYDWAKESAGIKYSYTLELFPSLDTANGFIVKRTDIRPSGEEVLAALKAIAPSLQTMAYRTC